MCSGEATSHTLILKKIFSRNMIKNSMTDVVLHFRSSFLIPESLGLVLLIYEKEQSVFCQGQFQILLRSLYFCYEEERNYTSQDILKIFFIIFIEISPQTNSNVHFSAIRFEC